MHTIPERTLIIVDPHVIYREGLRRLLYGSGFYPLWCDSDLPDDLPAAFSHQIPELLLIGTDLGMARQQIIEVKRLYPTCRILLLLDADLQEEIEAVVESGADSIIHRESSFAVIHYALRLVLEGVNVMPSAFMNVLRAARGPGNGEGAVEGQDTSTVMPATDALPASRRMGDAGTVTSLLPHEPPEQPAALSDTPVVTAAALPSIIPPSPALFGELSPRELEVLEGLKKGLPNKQIARQLDITEATVKVHVKSILRKTGVRNRTQVAMLAW